MQTKENKSHQLASWLLIANLYYEKTVVAVRPMARRQKKTNHISLLHGFLL